MTLDAIVDLMMTLPDVRRSESSDTPDFRVAGKIFATLPSRRHLVLKLTPEQQQMVTQSDPGMFSVVDGAWGQRGWTNADIARLDQAAALSALILAWTNVAPAGVRARHGTEMAAQRGSRQ